MCERQYAVRSAPIATHYQRQVDRLSWRQSDITAQKTVVLRSGVQHAFVQEHLVALDVLHRSPNLEFLAAPAAVRILRRGDVEEVGAQVLGHVAR